MEHDALMGQRRNSWIKKHGDCIVIDGWLYFEDGAKAEENKWGTWIEPSENPIERQKAVVRYYREVFRRVVNKFRQLTIDAAANAQYAEIHGSCFLVMDMAKEIEKLRPWVILREAQLEEAVKALKKLLPKDQEKKQAELDYHDKEAVRRHRKRLDKLKLPNRETSDI
jgi:hypothetical protein